MKILDCELLASKITALANNMISDNKLSGCSYLVKQDGNTVFEGHFGYADVDKKIPIEDGFFRIASMTKPITTFAILILIDRGIISFDDRVDKYIPEFKDIKIIPLGETDGEVSPTPVTIKHLLCHTSGIGSFKNATHMSDEDKIDRDATIRFFIRAGLDFEPFTQQAYSGFAAFDVLAKIIDIVSGKDYGDFIEDEIFKPCGMNETFFIPSEDQKLKIADMYTYVNGKALACGMCPGCAYERFPFEHKLAGAGLFSTLKDYSLFAEMLLNKGKIGDLRLVSEESFKLYATPHVPRSIMPLGESWGMGVRVITVEESGPAIPLGAFGWSGAYGTHFWVDPDNRIIAVLMRNSCFDGGAGSLAGGQLERAVYSSFL